MNFTGYRPRKGVDIKQVTSSHIASVGYEDGALHVNYHKGRPVVYRNVPEDVANQVMNSYSIGSALHLLVRGTYPHEYKD